MYIDAELHVMCLELALHLLATPTGQLDPVQLPHEPSGGEGRGGARAVREGEGGRPACTLLCVVGHLCGHASCTSHLIAHL